MAHLPQRFVGRRIRGEASAEVFDEEEEFREVMKRRKIPRRPKQPKKKEQMDCLVCVGQTRKLDVYSSQGSVLSSYESHRDNTCITRVGPHQVAVGSSDGAVELWKVSNQHATETPNLTTSFMGHTGSVSGVAWSSTEPEVVVSVSKDRHLRLWRIHCATSPCLSAITVHHHWLSGVRWLAGEGIRGVGIGDAGFAVSSFDRTVQILDAVRLEVVFGWRDSEKSGLGPVVEISGLGNVDSGGSGGVPSSGFSDSLLWLGGVSVRGYDLRILRGSLGSGSPGDVTPRPDICFPRQLFSVSCLGIFPETVSGSKAGSGSSSWGSLSPSNLKVPLSAVSTSAVHTTEWTILAGDLGGYVWKWDLRQRLRPVERVKVHQKAIWSITRISSSWVAPDQRVGSVSDHQKLDLLEAPPPPTSLFATASSDMSLKIRSAESMRKRVGEVLASAPLSGVCWLGEAPSQKRASRRRSRRKSIIGLFKRRKTLGGGAGGGGGGGGESGDDSPVGKGDLSSDDATDLGALGLAEDDSPNQKRLREKEIVVGKRRYVYVGSFDDQDRLTGPGRIFVRNRGLFHRRRLLFDGEFAEGIKEGHGREYQRNGKLLFEGFYVQGKRHGKGTEYSKKKKAVRIYQGLFENDKRHGWGTEYADDGITVRFTGVWSEGQVEKYDIESVNLETVDLKKITRGCTLEDRLGSGAFGDVYKVKYKGGFYAAKILLFSGMSDEARDRVIDETAKTLKLCTLLDHPNIIKIHGWSTQTNRCGYLCELCDTSVHALIEAAASGETPFPFMEKLRILRDTAVGISYLHSQKFSVMHRDLKWENVLLKDGVVKIIDFDMAAMDESSFRSSAMTHDKLGTKYFMAPEVIQESPYTKSCDVFSFGIMIYNLLFDTDDPYQYDPRENEFRVLCSCGRSRLTMANLLQHVVGCDLRPGIQTVPPERRWLVVLMQRCWMKNPNARPRFVEIVKELSEQYDLFRRQQAPPAIVIEQEDEGEDTPDSPE